MWYRFSAEGNPFGTYVKLKGLDAESFYLEETTGHVYSGMKHFERCRQVSCFRWQQQNMKHISFLFKKMKEAADLYDVLRNKKSVQNEM